MSSCQREACVVMIECDIGPLRRFVAGTTIRSELPIMFIPAGMTGITILWRAFVGIVRMTRLAGNVGMRASQREASVAMVEGGIFPLTRVMAG